MRPVCKIEFTHWLNTRYWLCKLVCDWSNTGHVQLLVTPCVYLAKCLENIDLARCEIYNGGDHKWNVLGLSQNALVRCRSSSWVVLQSGYLLKKLYSSPVLTVEAYFELKVLLPKHWSGLVHWFPLRIISLGQYRQNLNYFRGSLSQNFQFCWK